MQYTTSLNLKKPESTDNVKISDINENMDLIDAQLAQMECRSTIKSNKDTEGIFTTIEYKRQDNTLYMKSVLSGGTSPQYTTRTETYYEADGTTIKVTKIYTVSYDVDGNITSEVLQ